MATGGYVILNQAQHAREKGMWAGALTRTPIPNLMGMKIAAKPAPAVGSSSGTPSTETAQSETSPGGTPSAKTTQSRVELCPIERDHTPALLKIIDEGVVNATDHFKEHEGQKRAADRVTEIRLEFDKKTGRVAIYNDGPGIPADVHEQATKSAAREVRVPEVAFSVFLAGKNMKKQLDNVKGGTNGIGAKLITVHSAELRLETVADGKVYTQTFRDRLRAAPDPPAIKSTRGLPAALKKPHTQIDFLPAYAELGYSPAPSAQDLEELEQWCRWRAHMAAAYVGSGRAGAKVYFNGEPCETSSAEKVTALMVAHDPDAAVFSCAARAKEEPFSRHAWDVAVAIVPSTQKFGSLTIVNGVVTTKGPHITQFKKMLSEAVAKKLNAAIKGKNQAYTVAGTSKNLFLTLVGALPGAEWKGQRKDELQVPREYLTPYAVAPATLGKIASAVADHIILNLESANRRKKSRVTVDKYFRAKKAGGAESAKCSLFLAEGDSAMATIREGLTLGPKRNPGGPTHEYFGVYSLGGVIPNALKESNAMIAGGKSVRTRSKKLQNNKVLKDLAEILFLDYRCTYATAKERATLRYGRAIIATDQDLDGIGKIRTLVEVFFQTFWPALVEQGFLYVLETPVIRAYPKAGKNPPAEFTHEVTFRKWAETYGGNAAVLRDFAVEYYKGLGRHDEDETLMIFRSLEASLRRVTIDDAGRKLAREYYEPASASRKRLLSTPLADFAPEDIRMMAETRTLPITLQMNHEAKAYKLDDIQRKIPNVVDGIPVARRKILAGALRKFADSNKSVKVFQLGGYIAQHMSYHHGDMALNRGIIGMAARYPNANIRPYLRGIGKFGNRHEGIAAAASPRYVNVCLAAPYAKAMFPAADMPILPYVFEDGERAQPEYMCPVLPTALLESFNLPSEGWAHKSFARDFGQVVALVRAFVGGDPAVLAAVRDAEKGVLPADSEAYALLRAKYPLHIAMDFFGEHLAAEDRRELLRKRKGTLNSFGFYETRHKGDKSTITVTELPVGVSTATFKKRLESAARQEYIAEYDDNSEVKTVNVEIKLKPGAWDAICAKYGDGETDPVEHFLNLKVSLKPLLNYYNPDRSVLSFGEDYHRIFLFWAPVRRDLYAERILREITILELKIIREKEIVRFIGVAKGVDLAKKKDESAANAALEALEFRRVYSALLDSPKYTPTRALRGRVLEDPHFVSYSYLLNLPQRELVVSAKAVREKKIEAWQARVDTLNATLENEKPFPGASMWLAEIDAVVKAAARGAATEWKFETKK